MRKGGKAWIAVTAIVVVAIIIIAAVAVTVSMQTSKASTKHMAPEAVTYAKDWPLPGKDYNNSRATKTSSINSGNADTLGVAWSYGIQGIGGSGGGTSTPLILGNTVLFQDGRANVISLNLQTGAVNWANMFNASFVEGPNGPAVGYGKVFVASDAYTMAALDLNTGQQLWSNKLSNVKTTGIDIQPQVYDGKVYTSTVPGTGDVFYAAGGVGYIYALNQETGKQEWNFSTVKGDLWGHPEVNSGGGCWYTPAVDTETGTMYWSIANPAPFAGAKNWSSGSSFDTALYTDSLMALDHSDGKIKWFNQLLHHDIWDHDLEIQAILAKATIDNVAQNIVLTAGKMGYVYCLNRDTGAVLWDLPVGEHMNDRLDPITEQTTVLPGVLGGVETPMAYADGMVFVPIIDLSTDYIPTGLNFSSFDFAAGKGELVAINVTYGHIEWVKKYNSINVGAATVVNDVVFTAEYNGWIHGYNTKTGDEVFRYKAPAGINGWPAVAGDTIVWPCGVGGTPSLIALRVGLGSGMLPAIPPEISANANSWPLPNKDYSNTRAQTNSSITADNVGDLGLGWSFPIPGVGGFGAATSTPLVLGNTVYFQDLKANVFALDLRDGTTKWSKIYNASFVEGPNGPAVGYGKVFVAKDRYTMAALAINNGTELWTNDKLSPVVSTGIDIAPQVYDGMVYTSTVPGTGDVFYEAGGIGVLFALDQATGAQQWNFSTVKGDLWGHPEVNSGGGCWYPPAIDTETGTMYWGVANPAPFAGAPGWPSGSSFDTALYTDSVVAIDHTGGQLQWFTQCLAHDIWDHDLEIAPILAKANIHGEDQNIVLAAGKMGYVYCLNRDTGNLLWALPVGEHVNDTLDPITGPTWVSPGVLGGVETEMAYSDGILYVPVVDLPTQYIPTGLVFSSINFSAGKGELVAIDVKYGHVLWTQKFDSVNVGGATVVNDVVLTATFDGTIYAFNRTTGAQLFKWKAPAGINAWPSVVGDTILWPCGVGASPQLLALRIGPTPLAPMVTITSPPPSTTSDNRNVTIDVSVTGFTIVNPVGAPNVTGQGHIHYFKDVLPPTAPGVPAVTAPGTYVSTVNTSVTWKNVSIGSHMFSVELVNSNDTPLAPPEYEFVNVTVVQPLPKQTVYISANNTKFNVTSITVDASTNLTVVFTNYDVGVPHNFAVYFDSSATSVIYKGPAIPGTVVGAVIRYNFVTPPVAHGTSATYFFRCDIHPAAMNGQFIVNG